MMTINTQNDYVNHARIFCDDTELYYHSSYDVVEAYIVDDETITYKSKVHFPIYFILSSRI